VRVAVFSDVHANIHALNAVMDDIRIIDPQLIFCLGDLTGYGAFPNEVIETVREMGIPTLMGSYDEAVGFGLNDCGEASKTVDDFRQHERTLKWTCDRVTAENKRYLRELPMIIRQDIAGKHFLFVHGSPRDINESLYQDRPEATFIQVAKLSGCDVLVFGKTHQCYRKKVSNTIFVNSGSVGLPINDVNIASYGLVEIGKQIRVEFKHVEYDFSAANLALKQAGLPLLSPEMKVG
jgi:putative phosphoesterase